jgi:anionic cell wall polymer biosynthesis LytR-Cps2A-Psr (LCP) family protein
VRKRKNDKSVILLGAIILIVLAAVVFGFFQLRTDLFTEQLKRGAPLAILFSIASDHEYRFFEIFLYHPQTHKGAIVYIPGNVGSIIESLKRVDRIDALYNRGDMGPLRSKIEELADLKIPFVVDIREEDLVRLVDLLGGLDLFIPNPVDLTAGQKRVLLPSGSVTLDGDKLVDFIAYQDELELEMDQVGRKQKFLQAFLRKTGESGELLLEESAFRMVRRSLATNLNARSMAVFIRQMEKFDAERVIFHRVLGSQRVVDQKNLVFPHFEGELLKETVRQTLETIASAEVIREEQLTVSIQILNGTNVTGLARRAASVFQSFGYDVGSLGNAENDEDQKTVVIDRKGFPELAQKVAELIQCERVLTQLEPSTDQSIDVTVILGKDFDGRYCKK